MAAFGARKYAAGGTVDVTVTPSPVTAANSPVPMLGVPTAAQTAANQDAAGNSVMAPATPLAQPAFNSQPYANAIGAAPALSALSGGAGAPPSIGAISTQGIPTGSPPPPNMMAASSPLASLPPSAAATGAAPASASTAAPAAAPAATPFASQLGNTVQQMNAQELGLPTGVTLRRGGTAKPTHLAGGGIPTSEALSPWYARQADRQMMQPEGLIKSMGAGRTDIHSINVPAGSYVVPADVTSGLGEGNTLAGASVMDRMMHSNPYGIQSDKAPRGNGPPRAPAPFKGDPSSLPSSITGPLEARGGNIKSQQHRSEGVPIIVAGGEMLYYPGTIIKKFGDLDKGHQTLDKFVVKARQKTIKDMRGLKGPKKG